MFNDCQHCKHLEVEIRQLRLEIDRLRIEIDRLNNMINFMLSVVRDALKVVRKIIIWAKKILGRKSGVPRGKWAFAKGSFEVAMEVLARLEYLLREVKKC